MVRNWEPLSEFVLITEVEGEASSQRKSILRQNLPRHIKYDAVGQFEGDVEPEDMDLISFEGNASGGLFEFRWAFNGRTRGTLSPCLSEFGAPLNGTSRHRNSLRDVFIWRPILIQKSEGSSTWNLYDAKTDQQ